MSHTSHTTSLSSAGSHAQPSSTLTISKGARSGTGGIPERLFDDQKVRDTLKVVANILASECHRENLHVVSMSGKYRILRVNLFATSLDYDLVKITTDDPVAGRINAYLTALDAPAYDLPLAAPIDGADYQVIRVWVAGQV